MQIIDADGHVNDRPCIDEISKFMPPGNRTQVFPSFDHIHFHFLEGGEKRSRTGNVGPKEWIDFLDETGIDWTVVYPPLASQSAASSPRIGQSPLAARTTTGFMKNSLKSRRGSKAWR